MVGKARLGTCIHIPIYPRNHQPSKWNHWVSEVLLKMEFHNCFGVPFRWLVCVKHTTSSSPIADVPAAAISVLPYI
jgi:hypothetical protein